MSRVVLWLAARLVPRERRPEWLEHWQAELWAFDETSSESRGSAPRLRFVLGAWPDALAEAADSWRDAWVPAGLMGDLRDAWRAIARTPGTTLATVLVLGVGTAAVTSIFSVADAVLLRPLPGISSPDRLLQVGRHDAERFDNFSFPNYEDLKAAASSVVELAGYANRRVMIGSGLDAELVPAQAVTASYFEVLGVALDDGPGFVTSDERAFARRSEVVVSRSIWRRYEDAIRRAGGALDVNGRPFTVAGIAPQAFIGASTVNHQPAVWLPLGAVRDDDRWLADRGHSWIFVFGRRLPGVSFDATRQAVAAAHARLAVSFEPTIGRTISVAQGLGFTPADRAVARQVLSVLLAIAMLVLLVAAANVAGLQFARGLGRRHVTAIRLSLGASRPRVLRGLLVEQALLGAGGALVAFALTFGTSAWLRSALPYPMAVDFGPDLRVLGFALLASVAAGTLLSVWPLRRLTSAAPSDLVKVRQPDRAGLRAGRVLVTVELATSALLLVCGGLLLRSVYEVSRADPGFSTDRVLVVSVRPQPGRAVPGDRLPAEIIERLAALPGVTAAGGATSLPVVDPQSRRGLTAPSGAAATGPQPLQVIAAQVTPGFFAVLDLEAVAGRVLTTADRTDGETPVVINRPLARLLWPDAEPVGQVLRSGSLICRVVGVVSETSLRSVSDRDLPAMWLPLDGTAAGRFVLRGDGRLTSADVRAALAPMARDVMVRRVEPMTSLMAESFADIRLATEFTATFGLAALLMAAAGLYGVSAAQVVRRRHEFGVRLALGASPRSVVRSVVRPALGAALGGALLGSAAALAAGSQLRGYLFGVQAPDPLTIAAVTVMLVAISMFAAFAPARRAARTDPVIVLRME